MLSKLLAVAALCAAGLTGFAFDPPEYNGSFTRQGVSYAQRGGLGARDYVVTNIVVNGQPRPLPPYLYLMELDDTYPDDAEWYYQHADYRDGGHCSVRRSGNAVERNYDWHFDDAATFVLKVGGAEGRFASVGVANVCTNLTDSFVRSGAWSRYYKCLAGHTTDGINENGLVAEVNVTSGSWGRTSGAVHGLGAVRWALDHGTNAQQAAEFLAANVYLPQGFGVNFHYLIADATKTFIVENCEAHEVTNAPAVMTNFNLDRQGGEGYERYASLTNGATIESQWWTLAYNPATRPVRSSDLGGEAAQIWAAWNDGRTKEQHRGESFGGVTWWQTVHCSKYDIPTLALRIAVQEIPDWYAFTVPTVGKVKSVNGRVGEVVLDAAAVNALPDDKDELVNNDNFKEAVTTVSPPVELPAKWALANVTNANGGAVGAADVGALDTSGVYTIDNDYVKFAKDERNYLAIENDEGQIIQYSYSANGIQHYLVSPFGFGWYYKTNDGNIHRGSKNWEDIVDVDWIETKRYKNDDFNESKYLQRTVAENTYETKQHSTATYEIKADATGKLAEAKSYADTKFSQVDHSRLVSVDGMKYQDAEGGVFEKADKFYLSDPNNTHQLYQFDDTTWTGKFTWVSAGLTTDVRVKYNRGNYPYYVVQGIFPDITDDWFTLGESGTIAEGIFPVTIGGYTFAREKAEDYEKVRQVAYADDLSGYVPTSRKVNGQELTQDITIEGMTDNALVLTNGSVKTKGGAAVAPSAIGAIGEDQVQSLIDGYVSSTNQPFCDAVLAVGLNIDTNSVAILNEIAATFGGFPIAGVSTTIGGLLAALAAAVATLNKRSMRYDAEKDRYYTEG